MGKIETAIKKYILARNELTKLGVIRTDGSVVGNYGEWLVAKKYNLKLVNNSVNKGFDGVDNQGKKYQIKTRLVENTSSSTSFDFKKLGEFDYLIIVFLNKINFKQISSIKIPRDFVIKNAVKNSDSIRFRWNRNIERQIIKKDI